MTKLKIKCAYENHSIKKNKNIDIKFKMPYTELPNAIKLSMALNEQLEMSIKTPTNKFKLGCFSLWNINIDHDGETTFKLNSETDSVNCDKLVELICEDEIEMLIKGEIPDGQQQQQQQDNV